MEAVRIRKAGFALRLPHIDFVSRYGILVAKQAKSLKNMQAKAAAEILVGKYSHSSVLRPTLRGRTTRENWFTRLQAGLPFSCLRIQVAHVRATLGIKQDECLVGATKVFCKDNVQEMLESNR